MGAAPTLLSLRRTAALAAVVALLAAWDAGARVVPGLGRWPDILVIALVVLPVTFTVPLLALPISTSRTVLPSAALLAVLALLASVADADAAFNVLKLLTLTAVGYLFVQVFEALSWIVLVALVIPFVDAWSVWRGPTSYVVSEEPSLLERVSVAFRLPGDDGVFTLGPPDVLFFALFLAAAARFGLRTGWTWACMVALLSLSIVLTVAFHVRGLPALPAVAIGFLLPNVDLIWQAWRERGLEIRSR